MDYDTFVKIATVVLIAFSVYMMFFRTKGTIKKLKMKYKVIMYNLSKSKEPVDEKEEQTSSDVDSTDKKE